MVFPAPTAPLFPSGKHITSITPLPPVPRTTFLWSTPPPPSSTSPPLVAPSLRSFNTPSTPSHRPARPTPFSSLSTITTTKARSPLTIADPRNRCHPRPSGLRSHRQH